MKSKILMAAFVLSIASFQTVNADPVTFDVVFDGSAFGNEATASGLITIDSSQFETGGQVVDIVGSPTLPEFSLTVKKASNGNGTFFEDGLGLVIFDFGFEPLDLTENLVGQAGFDGFGIIGFTPEAPFSVDAFTIVTGGGAGDSLGLVQFTATSTIPEPTSGLVMIFAAAGLFRRRKSV